MQCKTDIHFLTERPFTITLETSWRYLRSCITQKRLETSAFLGIETFEISYYTAKMHLCRTMRFQKTLNKIDCTIEEKDKKIIV